MRTGLVIYPQGPQRASKRHMGPKSPGSDINQQILHGLYSLRRRRLIAKSPTNFGVGWPWSSTSHSTRKSQFTYVHLATRVTTTTSSTAGVAPAGAGVRGTRQCYTCVIASLGNNKKFHVFDMSLRYVKWGVTKVCVSICTYLQIVRLCYFMAVPTTESFKSFMSHNPSGDVGKREYGTYVLLLVYNLFCQRQSSLCNCLLTLEW